ncbi:MAG: 5'-nucleotidase, lipoprotein e(P4) family [Flammeovirgaceae bacterium]|nr:5'-nucleotidase, lipoprotein e(P4) family [Flammeovirgaceae bacterium]
MKKQTNSFIQVIILLSLMACASQHQQSVASTVNESELIINGKLFTTFYQQHAAEYKALCFQAYTLAKVRLDQILEQPSTLPLAIITDIDETILDNSPYAAHRSLRGKDYEPVSWREWVAKSQCDTLAGALSFFKYAHGKGVEIFYITNRNEDEREGTLRDLTQYGFPNADKEHLILRQSVSSKESRRQSIAASHHIILLIGDNLADFSDLFDKKSSVERSQAVTQLAAEFGKRFIVIPNPVYGDWEGAIFNYNHKFTPAQKDSVIRKSLKGY